MEKSKTASSLASKSTNYSSDCQSPAKIEKKKEYPIFNNEYEIMKNLGDGSTSKVYLMRSLKNPKKQYALKLLKNEYLEKDENAIQIVQEEIKILETLNHGNIIGIHGCGSSGQIKKPSGRILQNLVYIILEFVSGGIMFDMCQSCGEMGEDTSRFFINQLVDVLTYMEKQNVCHRDLKLENILVDEHLNLKVADFGFAKSKQVNKLKSYKGTQTYMAPEIRERKVYDGQKADIFSTGVIFFILTQGIFPFQQAKKEDYYYNFIIKGDKDGYFKATGGKNLSPEFKDLFWKMVQYDPKKRITASEIRAHPWMNKLNLEPLSIEVQQYRTQLTTRSNTQKCG